MVQNLLTLSELNRPLRSRHKGRQEEILSSAGKMRKPKNLPPIGDIYSTRQGGAMFLESSFFPAFQNLFLGVLRAFHEKASQRPPWRTTFFCLRALASSPDKSCFHSHSLWAFAIKPGALWNPHIGSCHLEHGLYFVAGKQLDLGAERSLPDGTFQLWALLMVNVGD